jgi:hypothetical protein
VEGVEENDDKLVVDALFLVWMEKDTEKKSVCLVGADVVVVRDEADYE